ncbi:hypothetical protein CEXT_259671 [Caerostris extrusa]|uniref:Uncharacterized protein n=1 Tax=Caerostris extrusa TaxID=172846 RepID=A0AAV4Q7I9_CAEEX|nr:hypothetical protein CEXT_259671 [Caerostris extrusa]
MPSNHSWCWRHTFYDRASFNEEQLGRVLTQPHSSSETDLMGINCIINSDSVEALRSLSLLDILALKPNPKQVPNLETTLSSERYYSKDFLNVTKITNRKKSSLSRNKLILQLEQRSLTLVSPCLMVRPGINQIKGKKKEQRELAKERKRHPHTLQETKG